MRGEESENLDEGRFVFEIGKPLPRLELGTPSLPRTYSNH